MVSGVSTEKSPWGRGALFAVSILGSFAAAGIIAGLNWRRMGKARLMWPTIIVSIIVFIAWLFSPWPEIEDVSRMSSIGTLVNAAVAWGLWSWQKGEYRAWKESHPEPRRAGWQIPTVAVLGMVVVVSGIIFAPMLMQDEATKQFNQAVEL